MPKFRPVSTRIWNSDTFLQYDCLMRDVFFYYHTRPESSISGIYEISLVKDSRNFLMPDGSPVSPNQLKDVISRMPENIMYDPETRTIFCVQFLAHNGLCHGNPSFISKAISKEMYNCSASPHWKKFLTIYPQFEPLWKVCQKYSESIQKVSSNFSDTLSKVCAEIENQPDSLLPAPQTKQPANSTTCDEITPANKVSENFPESKHKVSRKFAKTFQKLSYLLSTYLQSTIYTNNLPTDPTITSNYKYILRYINNNKDKSISIDLEKWARAFNILFPDFVSAIDAFCNAAYTERRRPLNEDSFELVLKELLEMADGNISEATRIANYSLKMGYRSFYRPKDQAIVQTVDTPPPAKELSFKAKKNLLLEAINKSNFGSLDEAITAYISDMPEPDRPGLNKKSVIESHHKPFSAWVQRFHSKSSNKISSFLMNLGLNQVQIDFLLSRSKNLSIEAISKVVDSLPLPAGKSDPDIIFKALAYGISSVKASHPLLEKAKSDGIDKKEYKTVPFQFRDLLSLNPSNGLYYAKEA